MATINTIEDIIRILREDGEARSAIRRELLTEELLAMPGQLVEMLKTQTAILEEQRSLRRDTILWTDRIFGGIRFSAQDYRQSHTGRAEESSAGHRFSAQDSDGHTGRAEESSAGHRFSAQDPDRHAGRAEEFAE